MRHILHIIIKIIFYSLLVFAFIFLCVYAYTHFFIKPSNDREWNTDQAILPYADISGSIATIHNIRDFTYASTTSYTPAYYDSVVDISTLKKVYYVVEPFSGFPGSAHTFLSFEFSNNKFLSISVEIRKEKGEKFSAIKGLFNQYELMYVIADERDVIKLRSNYRKDLVYVYPIKTTPEKGQQLFVDMLNRANKLRYKPEFYNSISNTCTTNIVAHINSISPQRIPFSLKVLLPGYSDSFAYDLGLIDTTLSFPQAREKYFINDKAMKYANDPDFSVKIRE